MRQIFRIWGLILLILLLSEGIIFSTNGQAQGQRWKRTPILTPHPTKRIGSGQDQLPTAARQPSSPALKAATAPQDLDQIIQPAALIITPKPDKGYLYIVWDVFAHRDKFDPKQKANHLRARRYAAYITLQYGWLKHPDVPEARFQLIVFRERDAYGGPRWDAVDKWYSFVFQQAQFKAMGIKQPAAVWAIADPALEKLGSGGEIKE